MSDHRPPYHRRITKPLPRAELAPVSTPGLESCPCCHGTGRVTQAEALEYRRTRETLPPPLSTDPEVA